MTASSRYAWLDCLRLMAGFSMLILHCTADPNGGPWTDYPTYDRIGPLALRTIAYTARTELFFIISFFLLFLSLQNRPRGYVETIFEQAQRLLIPFAFWTVFYAVFSLIKASAFGYFDAKLNALLTLRTWIEFALLGTSKYHMHFLPTLFLVVLAYPLMRKAIEAPLLGAAALIVCLMTRWQFDQFLYPRLWDDPNILAIGRSVKIITHIGYGMVAAACLGLWQKHRKQELESWLPSVLYLAVLVMIFKGFGTWNTIETGAWSHNFQPGFWADFVMPALLFTTFMLLGHRYWWNGFSRYAKYAFGIYLCHPIFLDVCEILLANPGMSPLIQVLIKIAVTSAATVLFVIFLSKRSLVSWTIGLGKLPHFSAPTRLSRRTE